jgi:asparagine synthase (glutamine-hydrolysing)
MCGIGGILRTDGQPIPEEWLDLIDARIAWRGPDGHGRFRDRVEVADDKAPGGKRIVEVAFVHRRLSIIDHEGGNQPMVSHRGRNESEGLVAVVFNGCIYNHRELRKELEVRGHRFVTDHSDTEVLVHGWREWGDLLPLHLKGMFAFAVWDRARTRMLLTRDLFGEKPLYISQGFASVLPETSVLFAFSSEPLALIQLQLPSSPPDPLPQLSTTRLGEEPSSHAGNHDPVQWTQWYLQLGYITTGAGVVDGEGNGAADVPAGCQLQLKATTSIVQENRRQRIDFDDGSDGDARIEILMKNAVARQLEADVPLGCFLSGGVDSSLVAAFAKHVRTDVRTFTVRMPDIRYDESECAARAAAHLKTDHTTLTVSPKPADDLIKLVEKLGQPFGDSSILPTYWVSRAAREHVKVALSGDGGDEMFLGYQRYLVSPILARWSHLLSRLRLSFLSGFHPKSRLHKLARLVNMAKEFSPIGLAAMESVCTLREIASLTDEPTHDPFEGESRVEAHLAIKSLREFDIQNYLPGDLLRKVDTASMACGLEVRCPFLDRDLARAALSMPIEQLMPRGQRKGLLRNIARKYLPSEIVDRPKMGFAIPIGEWFRNDDLPFPGGGMKTLLLDHLNSAEPFGPIQLNRKVVHRFIDEHMAGGFRGRDHGQKLFTLLTLSIWAKLQRKNTKGASGAHNSTV